MANLTLEQAELFHVALSEACFEFGLVARYQGALSVTVGRGLQPLTEAGIWDINLSVDDIQQDPGIDLLGDRLFRVSLDSETAGPGATNILDITLIGAGYSIYAFDIAEGSGFAVVLANVGIDANQFLSSIVSALNQSEE